MGVTNPELWKRLEDFNFDKEGTEFTFLQRVAKENNWSWKAAERVINEYKKFIYLACISDKPVTPSDAVDQVWHLHMTYTRNYWGEFCKNIIQRELHHDPSEGGDKEREKFHSLYEWTRILYRHEFIDEPPRDIWPTADIRFYQTGQMKRLNLNKYHLIKKGQLPKAIILTVGFTVFSAFALAVIFEFLKIPYSGWVTFYLGSIIGMVLSIRSLMGDGEASIYTNSTAMLGGSFLSADGTGSGDADGDSSDGSGCGGGCGGGGGD